MKEVNKIKLSAKQKEIFQVVITHEGSERAKPAIWYAAKENRLFYCKKSERWPSVFEVTSGHYKGKIIDPKRLQENKQLIFNQ